MLTVITGFSPAGWELYGERMVRTKLISCINIHTS